MLVMLIVEYLPISLTLENPAHKELATYCHKQDGQEWCHALLGF